METPDVPEKSLRGRKLIRHFVFSLLYHDAPLTEPIPSSRELAARFGMARSTVSLELEQLVREGVLVARQGVGTFLADRTVPGLPRHRKALVVGLVAGGGDLYCLGEYQWALQHAVGAGFIGRGGYIRPIVFSGADDEARLAELADNFVDALVWLHPHERHAELVRKAAERLPSAVADARVEGVDSVYADYEAEGYAYGCRLLAEGRRRLFAVAKGGAFMSGIRRAWAEAGVALDETAIFDDAPDTPERIRRAVAAGPRPEAFVVLTALRREIVRALLEAGVDLARGCRVLCDQEAAGEPGFAGWCHRPPYEEVARLTGELLGRRFAGDTSVHHILVKSRHTEVGTGASADPATPRAGRRRRSESMAAAARRLPWPSPV